MSTTAPFHNFLTASKMSTQTHTLIPAKACCTKGMDAKFFRNNDINMMMTNTDKGSGHVANQPNVKKVERDINEAIEGIDSTVPVL